MTIHITKGASITNVHPVWEDDYTSEAIGRNFGAMAPHGLLHGFRPVPDPNSTWGVQLKRNEDLGESLIYVRDESQNLSFSYRQTSSDPIFDLQSESPSSGVNRRFIALYVDYQIGQATDAEWRVVDEAELSNAWANAAAVVAEINVPASGGIDVTDINAGPADIAGFGVRADGTQWRLASANSGFGQSYGGWTQFNTTSAANVDVFRYNGNDAAGAYTGDQFITIGDTTAPGSGEVSVTQPLPDVEPGDLVYIRAWVDLSSVSDAVFELFSRIVTPFGTGRMAYAFDTSGYRAFADMFRVENAHDEMSIGARMLYSSGSATGEAKIDRLEVWRRRMDAERPVTDLRRPIYASNFHAFGGEGGRTSYAQLGWDSGANTLLLTFPTDQTSLPIQGDVGGTHRDIIDPDASLLRAANDATAHRIGITDGWHRFVTEGMDIALTQPDTINVDSGTLRMTPRPEGPPAGGLGRYDKSAWVEVDATSLTAIVSNNNDNIVYYDADTSALKVTEVAGWSSRQNPATVPIAYVTVSSNEVQTSIDLRDLPSNVEAYMPLTIDGSASSDRGRFDSLESAFRFITFVYGIGSTRTSDKRPVVEIHGTVTMQTTPLQVPDHVELRGGHPGATIEHGDLSSAALQVAHDIIIRDLILRPESNASVGTNPTVRLLGNTTIGPILFDNVEIGPRAGGTLPGQGIKADDQNVKRVYVRNSRIRASDRAVAYLPTGSHDAEHFVFQDTVLRSTVGGDLDSARVVGCRLEGNGGIWIMRSGVVHDVEAIAPDQVNVSGRVSDLKVQTVDESFPTPVVILEPDAYVGNLEVDASSAVQGNFTAGHGGDHVVEVQNDVFWDAGRVLTGGPNGVEITGSSATVHGLDVECTNTPDAGLFGVGVASGVIRCRLVDIKSRSFDDEHGIDVAGDDTLVRDSFVFQNDASGTADTGRTDSGSGNIMGSFYVTDGGSERRGLGAPAAFDQVTTSSGTDIDFGTVTGGTQDANLFYNRAEINQLQPQGGNPIVVRDGGNNAGEGAFDSLDTAHAVGRAQIDGGNSTATFAEKHNMSGITYNGVGSYTVNLASAVATMVVLATPGVGGGTNNDFTVITDVIDSTTVDVYVNDGAGAANPDRLSIVVFDI